MALFERSEFSHFSRCKSPPPPDSDNFPRRRVGQRWAPLPARSTAPSGAGGLRCLAAGEPLVAGRHQTENDDVRPGGRPGMTKLLHNNETMDLIRLASSAPSYA